jgi:hypothetical protein
MRCATRRVDDKFGPFLPGYPTANVGHRATTGSLTYQQGPRAGWAGGLQTRCAAAVLYLLAPGMARESTMSDRSGNTTAPLVMDDTLDLAPHGYEIFKHKQDGCTKVVLHL